ncbi:hypothetical protein BGZ96_008370 [Linnemannia gamsii]|uniref:Uncharacterized protein n=1 Tax=Linnemannia gamsii TaxID=64522 RepID=A0ABQ7K0I2_9FUNG|nr:hypothetical protein BGZ96_008370 [Linnemannia gamsii]
MLLDHVSIINPSTVLALALNLDSVLDKPSHSSMSRSPLNYLAHIQHLNLDDSVFTEEFYCSHNSNPPPSVLEYIQTDEFKEQCRSEGYSPRLLESEDVLLCHYKVFLYREASWWLAHPILEQLESMTIPLSCAHRYLGVVERLGNLQHVQFVMDQDIQYTPECASITNDSDDNSDMGTAHPGSATAKEGKWSGSTAAMIEFVKEHSRLFPVQLRTATCPPEDIWPAMYTICPNEVLLELCSILPPLSRPDFLGDENWMQFVAHPLTTDLRSVVDISRLGEGAFKWAVQEKRIKDGSVASAALLAKEETEHEDKGESLALLQEFGLVPLTSVNIKEDDVPITDEVDDIAYAFSETLQSLTVEMTYGTDEDEDENQQQKPPPIHVGRGWVDLPKLRDIWINKSDRLITHRMLLVHCPNVVSVSLTDESVQYWVQGIETCLPAHLPCLEKLTLEGWPALTFHPDTLHSTPKLTLLESSVGPMVYRPMNL